MILQLSPISLCNKFPIFHKIKSQPGNRISIINPISLENFFPPKNFKIFQNNQNLKFALKMFKFFYLNQVFKNSSKSKIYSKIYNFILPDIILTIEKMLSNSVWPKDKITCSRKLSLAPGENKLKTFQRPQGQNRHSTKFLDNSKKIH